MATVTWSSGNGGQNRLYLNDGTGTFVDATASRMPTDPDNTQAVACGDVDGDGDPDLVFGNFGTAFQNRLYLNDGTGTFADVTAARMPMDTDLTAAVAYCDVDGDGDPDLVLGNRGQSRLYLNDGTGTFTDAARGPHVDGLRRNLGRGVLRRRRRQRPRSGLRESWTEPALLE